MTYIGWVIMPHLTKGMQSTLKTASSKINLRQRSIHKPATLPNKRMQKQHINTAARQLPALMK